MLTAALLGAVALAIYRCAWISDGSMITFRQVINFVDGFGITWNPTERVQAFAHPAWFFLLSATYAVFRDVFVSAIALSLALSVGAAGLIVYYAKRRGSVIHALPSLVLLTLSAAFVDYGTSGLENPLSYLCIGAIALLALEDTWTTARLVALFLASAVAVLTRLDHVVLLAPLLLQLAFSQPRARILRTAAVGAVLLASWFAFATFYFGWPLPTPYYAKLGSGYAAQDYIAKGAYYFVAQAKMDPWTLVVALAGTALGLSRGPLAKNLAFGILFYLAYVMRIGGDFMGGRFFATPAYLAAFLIADSLALGRAPKLFLPALAALGLVLQVARGLDRMPLLSSSDYRNTPSVGTVTDERGLSHQRYGLLSDKRKWPEVSLPATFQPVDYKAICGFVGEAGLGSNGKSYIIDSCGLTDGFLARLPAVQSASWTAGHMNRKVPTNYGESVLRHRTLLTDKGLIPLFEDVQLARSAPLLDPNRWGAIMRLNVTKPYRFETQPYTAVGEAVTITSIERSFASPSVSREPLPGNPTWNDLRAILFGEGGLSIGLQAPRKLRTLSLSLKEPASYQVLVKLGDRVQATFDVPTRKEPAAATRPPGDARADGEDLPNRDFRMTKPTLADRIVIRPAKGGDGNYSLGHIRVD